DMLVMYTDGVTEARNPEGEEYEESRLKRFLSDPRSTDPAAALLDSVIQFIGDAEQHDDITAVTVEFLGGST
nr:SpoIIE family protein phosphatase [Candidatus Ozemobacteraceae bacterium]